MVAQSSRSPVTLQTVLQALRNQVTSVCLNGADPVITDVTLDSREVTPGTLFLARPGVVQDGHKFIDHAISKGASAVVCEHPLTSDIPHIVVPNVARVVGLCAACVHHYPARDLAIMGITGTNGKTTTTFMIEAMCRAANHKTAVIGTIETRIGQRVLTSNRTTPEATDLQRVLAQMRDEGVENVVMEVSSHGLELGRVKEITFRSVGFTNLSQDHLDHHGTMDKYFAAKKVLFTKEYAQTGCAIISDKWAQQLVSDAEIPVTNLILQPSEDTKRALSAAASKGSARNQVANCNQASRIQSDSSLESAAISPVSANQLALPPHLGFIAKNIVLHDTYSTFELVDNRGLNVSKERQHMGDIHVPMPGLYNVANALLALAMTNQIGIALEVAIEGLRTMAGVPGRMERVSPDGHPFTVLVDYAHTPDAIKNVLQNSSYSDGRLICVVGCGGDRDKTKRPQMADAALEHANLAIFTSDNPRSEDPAMILKDMTGHLAVCDRWQVVQDRREAIQLALDTAKAGDVIVVAGKGHETYQEDANGKHHFDDREEVREYLSSKGGADDVSD